MTDRLTQAEALLEKVCQTLTTYGNNHMAKDPPQRAKALTNYQLANEIDEFLAGREAVRSPDTFSPPPPTAMDMVAEFHRAFDAPIFLPALTCVEARFTHMPDDRVAVRVDFIVEELLELLDKGLGVRTELSIRTETETWMKHSPDALARAMIFGRRNGVEVADALGDLLYVIYGFALELGYDIDAVLREIHRSNMTKLGADGAPIVNGVSTLYRQGEPGFDPEKPVGKVIKGPHFREPDIAGVLNTMGGTPA